MRVTLYGGRGRSGSSSRGGRGGRAGGPRWWLWLAVLALVLAAAAWPGRRWWQAHARHVREAGVRPLAAAAAARHGVPLALVLAVIRRESDFHAGARGLQGEVGLMQLMRGATTDWATAMRRPPPSDGALFDPALNLEVGTWYLAQAWRRWQDHPAGEVLALAQYNAGPSRAVAWAALPPENLPASIPFASTRQYIRAVQGFRAEYETGGGGVVSP